MRSRDEDCNVKVLALFARCTECKCSGFRPLLSGDQAVEDGGLFLVDFKQIRTVESDALCRGCNHAMVLHAPYSAKPSKSEQEKLISWRTTRMLYMVAWQLQRTLMRCIRITELRRSFVFISVLDLFFQIVYQVFQLCLSALKKWSTTIDVLFGTHKFETMSMYNIVTALIAFHGESMGLFL
ncbi:hypothetical protein GCK32_002283 [Trichostrongylus colubriformis]|uniref:Uncharacterized protein n=1 Tax=Trichostrongylus colubriformis TaxID=6319 RepID=A0AAN8FP16_TRICO